MQVTREIQCAEQNRSISMSRIPSSLTIEYVLQEMTVKEALLALGKSEPNRVVILLATDTIKDALQTLNKYNILSAPVWSEEHNGYNVVDVLDLCAAVFQAHGQDYESVKASFFDRTLVEVCNLSHANVLKPIRQESRFGDLLMSFSTATHRAIVVDDTISGQPKITHIITQMDLVRFFLQNYEQFFASRRISMPLAGAIKRSDLYQVAPSVRVTEALAACLTHRFGGAAVVDPSSSQLIANISISDLRSITPDTFWTLWLSLSDYLRTQPKIRPPVFCFEDAPLYHVLERFVQEHVHRMYVVDSLNHPLGVLTTTDVLNAFLRM